MKRPVSVFSGLLLLVCGGCANRYFAWNKPLPVDDEHGFVSYGAYDQPLFYQPVMWGSDDRRATKDFCREFEKQHNINCPTPTRLR